jgi:hypothetical protein
MDWRSDAQPDPELVPGQEDDADADPVIAAAQLTNAGPHSRADRDANPHSHTGTHANPNPGANPDAWAERKL